MIIVKKNFYFQTNPIVCVNWKYLNTPPPPPVNEVTPPLFVKCLVCFSSCRIREWRLASVVDIHYKCMFKGGMVKTSAKIIWKDMQLKNKKLIVLWKIVGNWEQCFVLLSYKHNCCKCLGINLNMTDLYVHVHVHSEWLTHLFLIICNLNKCFLLWLNIFLTFDLPFSAWRAPESPV